MPVESQPVTCPQCGYGRNASTAKQCENCGRKLSQPNRLRSIAPVLLAYGVLIAGGYFLAKNIMLPLILGDTDRSAEVSSRTVDRPELTLLGDTFSGYSTFRNGAFQSALEESGTTLNYEDEFDQSARAAALGNGKADFLVTTLDQFLRHKPKGKIVGMIDNTIGADAAVLNNKKYPQLKSLLDLKKLVDEAKAKGQKPSIVYAVDTPSEYLALVLDTKFDTFNLSDFDLIEVADASDAWAVMQEPSKNVAIAILWEPFVTQAREQGYTVVLSSRDTPKSIVDVLVASDRVIQSQPEQVSNLLETYYRRIDTNMRSAAELQQQIAEDGDLAPEDAAAVLDGIDFFTAAESKTWMEKGTLTQRINAIASVLVLSGQLDAVPAEPQKLYNPEPLAKAAKNTQTLISLIRADDPELAAKLEGAVAGQGSPQAAVSTRQIQDAPNIGNLDVQQVRFEFASTQLADNGTQVLDQLAAEISEFNPETVAVRVIGHTSKTGDPETNKIISQQRADVVAQYLKNKGLKQNISAEGKGFSEPLPNISPDDPQNQRTEIRLVRIDSQTVSSR
ncbi:Outer membrane protein A [Acaryochloris thomasi RCC1774]|uniref:Outer membrane protein A n=1 Tax=Acaryochloris thomasi RCC1774 TaxID=1764569 RepID=A0A2W1JNW3_9CYAN|nr:OmpA family protein [Acaryochloris thomasi]PZD72562.1 Outer membrane protein A [Acaryochloris thomasi RCC1774]